MVELKLKVIADLQKLRNDIAKTVKEKFQIGVGGGGGQSKTDKMLTDQTKAISAGFLASQAILKGILNFSKRLVAASPELQKSISVLNKSFEILLRPLGDLFASVLRPFALQMIKFAIPFYKKAKANLDKPGAVAGGLTGAAAGAVAGGAAGAKIGAGAGAFFGGPVGASAGGLIGGSLGAAGGLLAGGLGGITIGAKLGEVAQKINEFSERFRERFAAMVQEGQVNLKDWGKVFSNWFSSAADNISIWLQDWGTVFSNWFTEGVGSLEEWLSSWGAAIQTWYDQTLGLVTAKLSEWTQPIRNWFDQRLQNIQVWLKDWGKVLQNWFQQKSESIGTWLSGWASKLRTFFLQTVPNFIGEMISIVKDRIAKAVSSLVKIARRRLKIGGDGEGATATSVNDFILTKNGQLIRTDPNDNIVGFKGAPPNLGGGGGSTVINVELSMMDASGISSTTLETIARAIEDRLKESLSSRTIQQVGI